MQPVKKQAQALIGFSSSQSCYGCARENVGQDKRHGATKNRCFARGRYHAFTVAEKTGILVQKTCR